jgi:hypothetical protein
VVRAASAVESAVGDAVGAASRRWDERPGARVRRVRRLARQSLPYLYDGGYWVLDGHNRVAAALYTGQLQVDANVTELVPPGAISTQRAGSLASTVLDGRAVRTAGAGQRTGGELGVEPVLPIRDEPP